MTVPSMSAPEGEETLIVLRARFTPLTLPMPSDRRSSIVSCPSETERSTAPLSFRETPEI